MNQTKVASYAGNFQIIKANSVGYKMITWQDRKGIDDSVTSKAYLMIPQGKTELIGKRKIPEYQRSVESLAFKFESANAHRWPE